MRRAAPRPRPGFSRRAFRWLRRLRGKRPAAGKAWPWFATGPARLAFHRGPRSNAKQPRCEPPPGRTARSTACGTRRGGRVLRQEVGPQESLFHAPAVRPILPWKPAACFELLVCLIVFDDRRNQMRCKIQREPVQRGVLLFEKVLQGGQV